MVVVDLPLHARCAGRLAAGSSQSYYSMSLVTPAAPVQAPTLGCASWTGNTVEAGGFGPVVATTASYLTPTNETQLVVSNFTSGSLLPLVCPATTMRHTAGWGRLSAPNR